MRDDLANAGPGTRIAYYLTVLLMGAGLGLKVGIATHSSSAGVWIFVATAALIVSFVVVSRSQGARQVRALVRGRSTVIEVVVDMTSLPGEWPTTARSMLHPAAAPHLPGLPAFMSLSGDHLVFSKKTGAGSSPEPLRIRVWFADIASVDVGRRGATELAAVLVGPASDRPGRGIVVDNPYRIDGNYPRRG